jgi:hypothetical protein
LAEAFSSPEQPLRVELKSATSATFESASILSHRIFMGPSPVWSVLVSLVAEVVSFESDILEYGFRPLEKLPSS